MCAPLRLQMESFQLTASTLSFCLYLSNSSSPPGLRPGPNSRDFWHFSSPLTQSFGTPESPRWAWGDSRRIQRLSHTPNQLIEQLVSLEKQWEWVQVWASSRGVRLDDGLHTDELWCEDSWRDSIVEVFLKFQQLAHEVEVWGDDGPPGFDKLVGVCHGHPGVLHQVGNHDGGWTGHACLAVD